MSRRSDEHKNVEQSVRDRLFNVAKAQDRDFQSVLKLYFLERFLYRLSISRFREGLLLKGALLFVARADPRSRPFARPTKDIDLEATVMQPDLPGLAAVFGEIAIIAALEDGVRFDPERIAVAMIREEDRYGGIRAHVDAYLGKARDRIQIDVGFGDAVTPGPVTLRFPTLIDGVAAPDLAAYPIESVVAEKWEATISLGEANSRLKDLIDIDELAGTDPFDGSVLREAIRRTFERRRTHLDPNSRVLGDAYRLDPQRQALWTAARRRYRREQAPERLSEVMVRVLAFVGPPYLAAAIGEGFSKRWDPERRGWIE